jgi:hypothetical protein
MPAVPSYASGISDVPLLGDTIGDNFDRRLRFISRGAVERPSCAGIPCARVDPASTLSRRRRLLCRPVWLGQLSAVGWIDQAGPIGHGPNADVGKSLVDLVEGETCGDSVGIVAWQLPETNTQGQWFAGRVDGCEPWAAHAFGGRWLVKAGGACWVGTMVDDAVADSWQELLHSGGRRRGRVRRSGR